MRSPPLFHARLLLGSVCCSRLSSSTGTPDMHRGASTTQGPCISPFYPQMLDFTHSALRPFSRPSCSWGQSAAAFHHRKLVVVATSQFWYGSSALAVPGPVSVLTLLSPPLFHARLLFGSVCCSRLSSSSLAAASARSTSLQADNQTAWG
jgi:hypothetical protein